VAKIIEGTGRRRKPRRPGSNIIQWERKVPGPRQTVSPGDRFGRLTLVKFEYGRWVCHCDCGGITRAMTAKLKADLKKSCGCLKDAARDTNGEEARYDLI
jgi:hypothetical protein